MKRIFLALAMCLAVLSARTSVLAQEHEGTTAAPHAGEAHEAAGEHGHSAPLLPSNGEEAKEYFLGPAIWTLVIFVIMLAILYPTAWKNVLAGLKTREERIRSDIAEAEASRAKAEATLREYNAQLAAAEERGRQILAAATADAEKLATSIRMKAQAESEEIKERAQKDIEATRDQAMRDFKEYAADVATSVASKIIRRSLNPQDQQDLVRQSLEQLQTVK